MKQKYCLYFGSKIKYKRWIQWAFSFRLRHIAIAFSQCWKKEQVRKALKPSLPAMAGLCGFGKDFITVAYIYQVKPQALTKKLSKFSWVNLMKSWQIGNYFPEEILSVNKTVIVEQNSRCLGQLCVASSPLPANHCQVVSANSQPPSHCRTTQYSQFSRGELAMSSQRETRMGRWVSRVQSSSRGFYWRQSQASEQVGGQSAEQQWWAEASRFHSPHQCCCCHTKLWALQSVALTQLNGPNIATTITNWLELWAAWRSALWDSGGQCENGKPSATILHFAHLLVLLSARLLSLWLPAVSCPSELAMLCCPVKTSQRVGRWFGSGELAALNWLY